MKTKTDDTQLLAEAYESIYKKKNLLEEEINAVGYKTLDDLEELAFDIIYNYEEAEDFIKNVYVETDELIDDFRRFGEGEPEDVLVAKASKQMIEHIRQNYNPEFTDGSSPESSYFFGADDDEGDFYDNEED